jgi:hypothetical protein
LVVALAGCQPLKPIPEMPEIGVPSGYINTIVKVDAPKGYNDFKLNKPFAIEVTSISNDQIIFQSDLGARLFYLNDNQWVETTNLNGIYPDGTLIFPKSRSYPDNTAGTTVFPNLPKTKQAVTVRVVVIGNIYKDGQATDQKTAAYVDVTLYP